LSFAFDICPFTFSILQHTIKEESMDRRKFISTGIGGGIIAGTSLLWGKRNPLLAAPRPLSPPSYDLVAVKGGEPEVMFDKAIELFGGMDRFVTKGQTVVVKPNIGWDVSPERAGNTNPKLVKRIIEHCYDAGAKDVFVFDHTCDNWTRTYKTSGIEKAAQDAGAKVVSGGSEGYYQEVAIPVGKTLKRAKVHELLLSSNVIINVPVLKVHDGARVTIAMKNFMGVVWDRRYWHRNDLQQCIADFATYCRPALNVVDAYAVMNQNGPRGTSVDDVVKMGSLIMSRDIVATDAASAKMLGFEPEEIGHIRIANEMHVGTMDLTKLSINRIKL
jgi:uncharacterized protein (DUF362 family)